MVLLESGPDFTGCQPVSEGQLIWLLAHMAPKCVTRMTESYTNFTFFFNLNVYDTYLLHLG